MRAWAGAVDHWEPIFGPNDDGDAVQRRLGLIFFGSVFGLYKATGYPFLPLNEHEGSLTSYLSSGVAQDQDILL